MKAVDDALTGTGRRIRQSAELLQVPPWRPGTGMDRLLRLRPLLVGAATLITILGGVLAWMQGSGRNLSDATPPEGFGVWQEMPEAPISPRPYMVSVWTGGEALFWAGASLDRGFAYTDGAAFDPSLQAWRELKVPGWGHPGLSGVYFDGELYALAKGGGTRLDLTTGVWSDLPEVEGMYFRAVVATDRAVWGIGPALLNPEGQPDVAIARYEKTRDGWVYGPIFEATDDIGVVFDSAVPYEQAALWTGSEIVVWAAQGRGIAFDPNTQSWRELTLPSPPEGSVVTTRAVVSGPGMMVVATVKDGSVDTTWLAVETDGEWDWREIDVAIEDLSTTTVSPAGEWLVLFPASAGPVTVHIPSWTWVQHGDWPLGSVEAPNVVWTGEALVVWGGAFKATDDATSPVTGAIWIPPSR